MATLDLQKAQIDIKQEVRDVKKTLEELENLAAYQRKARLEKQFQQESDTAAIADEVTRLQRLTNEIKEFTEAKSFYQLGQVISVAISEAKNFQARFCETLPLGFLDALEEGAKAIEESLHLTLRAIDDLQGLNNLNEKSSVKQLRRWAVSLEILAEEIENHLALLSFENFSLLECLCETVVLKSRKKGKNADSNKEAFRRRIRFAAGFILNLIEVEREEAEREDEELLHDMRLLSYRTLDSIYSEDD